MSGLIRLARVGVFTCLLFVFSPISALAFSFSPQVIDVTPGAEGEVEITYQLLNDSREKESFEATLVELEFGADNQIAGFSPSASKYNQIIELDPGTTLSQEVGFIPDPLVPAYAIYLSSKKERGSNVDVEGGALIPIFIQYEDIEGGLTVLSINPQKSVTTLPLKIEATFQNTGSSTERPSGTYIIKSMLGSIVATIPVNPMGERVVPGAKRTFETVWQDESKIRIPRMGIYTIELSTTDASIQGDGLVSRVIILPWKTLLILLMIVLLLAAFTHGTKNKKDLPDRNKGSE